MDARSRLLYWLLEASRGGPTRSRIIRILHKSPSNMHQLAVSLNLDYKTVQGHVETLVENGIIYRIKDGYGAIYFISPEFEENEYMKKAVGDEGNEKNK
jgi:DNA-binding transcriptional ArsR family regulator